MFEAICFSIKLFNLLHQSSVSFIITGFSIVFVAFLVFSNLNDSELYKIGFGTIVMTLLWLFSLYIVVTFSKMVGVYIPRNFLSCFQARLPTLNNFLLL